MPDCVECSHCADRVPHLYHWYEGCTCAAGGAYEDHSFHCDLYGVELIRDDALLVDEAQLSAES